jgi:hypothetical protein
MTHLGIRDQVRDQGVCIKSWSEIGVIQLASQRCPTVNDTHGGRRTRPTWHGHWNVGRSP